MKAHRKQTLWLWAVVLLPAILGLWWSLSTAQAQAPFSINYGETKSGEVMDRLGDEWVFSGCMSDVVTITMQSEAFASYLMLYGPVGRDSLTEAGVEGPEGQAVIGGFVLPESGPFTIIATGANIRDRGAYSLTLEAEAVSDRPTEQVVGLLGDGDVVTGSVETRLGEAWLFRGCMNDVVAVKVESDDFEPFVAVYGPGGEESMIETSGTDGVALIEDLILPTSGEYVVMAAGANIRDRGNYMLTFTVIERAKPAPTATPTPTGTLTPQPTATNTPVPPTPTRTPTSGGGGRPPQPPRCVVMANQLNLRPGPGTDYTPPIGVLPRDTVVVPLNRNSNTSWIRVEVVPSGPIGWVSAAPQFIACNINLNTLPLGAIPPTVTPTPTTLTTTPTHTSTATVTPTGDTPTPTVTPTGDTPTPTYTPTPTDTPTVTTTPTPTDTPTVTPTMMPTETPTEAPTETPTLMPTTPPEEEQALHAEIVQTGAGQNGDMVSGALVFQAMAYDPDEGMYDGAGIDHVLMQIFYNGSGHKVYERQENNAAYCAFSGGEPDCNVWYFHDNDNEWPSGDDVENGQYTLRARVRAEDGEEKVIDRVILISN